MSTTTSPEAWGVLIEFPDATSLEHAVAALSKAERRQVEAYAPFALEGLAELLYPRRSPLPIVIAVGGLIGSTSMYALQYWICVYANALNVGGRPLHSWPAFIPPTFEIGVLLASLFALLGVIGICRLPRLHHPVFEVEAFKRASTDGFFLSVHQEYSNRAVYEELARRYSELGATHVWEVPNG